MGGSRLLDLDLRARIRSVLDLIRIVHARSDDQGRAGPRAAALGHRG